MTTTVSQPQPTELQGLDVLAVGELLVDLIGEAGSPTLAQASGFTRHAGGSAANLATNLARLGVRVALVASVGRDGLGDYLTTETTGAGLPAEPLARDDHAPTSLVLVNRTDGTAQFVAYRGADAQIHPEHVPEALARSARVFHTSCFALSREPARGTILAAAETASAHGATLSVDVNYAPQIWPHQAEARNVLARYLAGGALVKASTDDLDRLWGEETTEEDGARRLHEAGAKLVCVTEGPRGSRVSWNGGTHVAHVESVPAEVVDATGAGDAFWAGFLTAWLDGQGPPDCARAGSRMAALKLAGVGPISGRVDREEILHG